MTFPFEASRRARDLVLPSRRSVVGMAFAPAALAACGGPSGERALAKRDAKYALEVLERAPEHGFAPGSFRVRELKAAIEGKDPKAAALLRASIVDYARAQHGLAIPAKARPAAWGMKPPAYDAAAELNAALQGRRFREWIDALPPPASLYRTLQQSYVATLKAAKDAPQAMGAAATLRANLERLRWLPREEPATRVDVNIASATLLYVVDGQPRLSMRTACGKPGDETPMLTSKIDHIVLNPPWNVPETISTEELLPKGPEYLASHGFTTDEAGHLVQQPGPESALGLVKFDFDNPYAVYLHDTPAKGAFDRGMRAVSHGCVRLERALDLANLLLATEPGWSPQRISDVLASRETTTVKLGRPVTVRLMYLTAVPEAGTLRLVPDIYGWDAPVLQLLDRATLGART